MVWLPPAGIPLPIPPTQKTGGPPKKAEYHLAEFGAQFWGRGQETKYNADIIASVYSTLKETK